MSTPATIWNEITEVHPEKDGTIWVRVWAIEAEHPGLQHLVWATARTPEHKARAQKFIAAKQEGKS